MRLGAGAFHRLVYISAEERLPNALVGSGVGGCEQVDSVVGCVGNEYSADQTGEAVAI